MYTCILAWPVLCGIESSSFFKLCEGLSRGWRRYEEHEDIPDGVYTDNVVWKDALLHDNGHNNQPSQASQGAACNVTASNVDVPVHVWAADDRDADILDYPDEASGAPRTPPTTEPQEPNNHHGTDDVDEFGPAPSRGVMTNVVVAVPQTEATVIVDLTSSTQKEPSGKEIDCTPTIDNLLHDLEQQAKALGVGRSEWYEIRKRPLLEILALIETLRTPRSEGAASSGSQ